MIIRRRYYFIKNIWPMQHIYLIKWPLVKTRNDRAYSLKFMYIYKNTSLITTCRKSYIKALTFFFLLSNFLIFLKKSIAIVNNIPPWSQRKRSVKCDIHIFWTSRISMLKKIRRSLYFSQPRLLESHEEPTKQTRISWKKMQSSARHGEAFARFQVITDPIPHLDNWCM